MRGEKVVIFYQLCFLSLLRLKNIIISIPSHWIFYQRWLLEVIIFLYFQLINLQTFHELLRTCEKDERALDKTIKWLGDRGADLTLKHVYDRHPFKAEGMKANKLLEKYFPQTFELLETFEHKIDDVIKINLLSSDSESE